VGVLRQERFMNDEDAILDVAIAGDELVAGAQAEQRRLLAEPVPDAERLAELEDRIAARIRPTIRALGPWSPRGGQRRRALGPVLAGGNARAELDRA
jgi:hypothetical protein